MNNMNGLRQRYRTLGELLTELKARLGFVAQGPASNNNNPVMISMLQEGHDYVYAELNPPMLRKKTTMMMERGAYLYDWHNDQEDENIDPKNVLSVWVVKEGSRSVLMQGISERERADTTRGTTRKYDTLNGQMEVWPIPDSAYGLNIEYLASPSRFFQMFDRPSVPDRLVLLYAIANAKAHYRHPDAQAAAATFANLLRIEKVKQHENRRYFMKGTGNNGGQGLSLNEQFVSSGG